MRKNLESLLETLKSDTEKVHRLQYNGESYGLLVLGRGESLFFQKGEQAFICDISARYSELDKSSIKKWDDSVKILKEERQEISQIIAKLYKQAYSDELRVN